MSEAPEPQVPPPPRPGEEPGLDAELRWKVQPPTEEGPEYEAMVTPAAGTPEAPPPALALPHEAPPALAMAAPHIAAADSGLTGAPTAGSEADIVMFGKKVHVHGELAKKQEVHPPQHAPTSLNYAKVAREEIHDVAEHPPHVTLVPGATTGVEEWDKVNSPRTGRTVADVKELLVTRRHSQP